MPHTVDRRPYNEEPGVSQGGEACWSARALQVAHLDVAGAESEMKGRGSCKANQIVASFAFCQGHLARPFLPVRRKGPAVRTELVRPQPTPLGKHQRTHRVDCASPRLRPLKRKCWDNTVFPRPSPPWVINAPGALLCLSVASIKQRTASSSSY